VEFEQWYLNFAILILPRYCTKGQQTTIYFVISPAVEKQYHMTTLIHVIHIISRETLHAHHTAT